MNKSRVVFVLASLVLWAMAGFAQTESLGQSIDAMPWTNSVKLALELFKQAEQTQMVDPARWLKLGLVLYDGQSYNPALGSFRHIIQPETNCCALFKFGAYTWQGHVYDVLGLRKQAVDCYKKALAIEGKNKGLSIHHDQFGLVINRAWVKERLSVPFAAKGHGPQPKTQ